MGEKDTGWYVNMITASIGLFFCFVVLYLHFWVKALEKIRFVKWGGPLTISSALHNFDAILYLSFRPDSEDGFCAFLAWANQLTGLMMIFWDFVLAFHIWYPHYRLLGRDQIDTNVVLRLEKFSPYIQVIVWVVALTLSLVPFAFDAYGDAGIWCWIVDDPSWMRWVFFYGPLWAIVFILLFFVCHISYINYRRKKDDLYEAVSASLYLLLLKRTGFLFLISILVTWLLPSTNRFVETVNDGGSPDWLRYMHVSTLNLSIIFILICYLSGIYIIRTHKHLLPSLSSTPQTGSHSPVPLAPTIQLEGNVSLPSVKKQPA